jgi:DNA-binding beta-propeller fold protein YncE
MTRATAPAFGLLLALGVLAQDGAPEEPLVLGEGAHAYAWVDGWPALPEGFELGYTHGCVAVDAQDRVYVQTNAEHAICVFEPDGTLARTFGPEVAGGLADGLHGMCIAREGEEEFLYVTHLSGRVLKLTLAGDVVWEMGYPEESGHYPGGERFHPTGVAVAANGDVYVADGYGRHWVHRFDKDRRYLASFGGMGTEPGAFKNPHGIRIEERFGREYLVVSDRENRRLQTLTLEGKPMRVLTDGIRRPCNTAGSAGVTAVADIEGRVTLLAANGAVLAHLGEQTDASLADNKDVPREKQQRGRFHSPHGIAFDSQGAIYVVDWQAAGRITKLAPAR